MRTLLLAALYLQSAFSLGQQLSSADFKLTYSPQGLSSLKRVHDTYDTDYIAGGLSLGDVYIRYRTSGQTTWKEALSATAAAQSGQGSFLQDRAGHSDDCHFEPDQLFHRSMGPQCAE